VTLDNKQIIPKISKDESLGSNNGPDNMHLCILVQTKFVRVSERNILVICSTKGIFFFDEDGVTLIYFFSFHGMKPSKIEETNYGRGITVLNENSIAIGTSSGTILRFEVPPKGDNISLAEEIEEKNLTCGITDLVSSSNYLIASDTEGNIFGWLINKSIVTLSFTVRGKMK